MPFASWCLRSNAGVAALGVALAARTVGRAVSSGSPPVNRHRAEQQHHRDAAGGGELDVAGPALDGGDARPPAPCGRGRARHSILARRRVGAAATAGAGTARCPTAPPGVCRACRGRRWPGWLGSPVAGPAARAGRPLGGVRVPADACGGLRVGRRRARVACWGGARGSAGWRRSCRTSRRSGRSATHRRWAARRRHRAGRGVQRAGERVGVVLVEGGGGGHHRLGAFAPRSFASRSVSDSPGASIARPPIWPVGSAAASAGRRRRRALGRHHRVRVGDQCAAAPCWPAGRPAARAASSGRSCTSSAGPGPSPAGPSAPRVSGPAAHRRRRRVLDHRVHGLDRVALVERRAAPRRRCRA